MTQWIARFTRVHFLVATAAIVCFVSTFAYLQSLEQTISIAQLNKDVVAGTPIDSKDVEFVDVRKDSVIAAHTLSATQFDKDSVIARVDLSKSDLLTKSNTVRRADEEGLQSLSIGVSIDRANGGDIKKNDFVDIWQTGEEAQLIVRSVSVRNVVEPDKRLGISTSQSITLVVAVSPQDAKALSRVIGSQDVMIVLSNGVESSKNPEDSQSPDESNDFEPIELSRRTEGGD
jgi:hypothetical protein